MRFLPFMKKLPCSSQGHEISANLKYFDYQTIYILKQYMNFILCQAFFLQSHISSKFILFVKFPTLRSKIRLWRGGASEAIEKDFLTG
jgi:hypothetical protein